MNRWPATNAIIHLRVLRLQVDLDVCSYLNVSSLLFHDFKALLIDFFLKIPLTCISFPGIFRYFLTAKFQLESLLPDFDFFPISEHGLYDDQLYLHQPENFLPEFNCLAVSSSDNPDFLDGHRGHGGVALFWRLKFNDFITSIQIDSDRIVGIKFSLSKENTFHLLSVYLPASSHPIVDFREVLDLV